MNNPVYEYSRSKLQERIDEFNSLDAPFGLVVRYAVKANPHKEIVKMMNEGGMHFDASSSYEAAELIEQGVSGDRISLSSQQSAHNLEDLLKSNVQYVATSKRQLNDFFKIPEEVRGEKVAIRINPGMGQGFNQRTSTGGVSASFGIWHEYIDEVLDACSKNKVEINRVHIHIGSGADPSVWSDVITKGLEIMDKFEDAKVLDIGGGFKVHRYGDEKEAYMPEIFKVFSSKLLEYKENTGREISLEVEPGTYMVAHCGALVAQVDDVVDTGENGYKFLRLNTGMNDFLRSALYGSLHKIEVMNNSSETVKYVVVGHNCESGDILTPMYGDPEGIEPRELRKAEVGDEIRIYDTGAYCGAMRATGYNSFPSAEEVMVD